MEHPTHRKDRTVYINNIPKGTTEDDLFTIFQRAGPIEKVIFKNVEGAPQHALIVFRRVESVMFCIDNVDLFTVNGHQLGIRPLRESRVKVKQQTVPHSAGFERAKQEFFKFDSEALHHPTHRPSESTHNMSNIWQSPFGSPSMFLQPPPPQRRVPKPPPIQMPPSRTSQIWVPAGQPFAEPFTAPPFSTLTNRFVFPGHTRTLDQFYGMLNTGSNNNLEDLLNKTNGTGWPSFDNLGDHY